MKKHLYQVCRDVRAFQEVFVWAGDEAEASDLAELLSDDDWASRNGPLDVDSEFEVSKIKRTFREGRDLEKSAFNSRS